MCHEQEYCIRTLKVTEQGPNHTHKELQRKECGVDAMQMQMHNATLCTG